MYVNSSSGPASGRGGVSEREADALVANLIQLFPDCAIDTLSALVRDAFDDLRDAKVQAFRSILAERIVRDRLVLQSKRD